MKVLLIQPPYTISRTQSPRCQPPLGLAYLASSLKDEYELRLLDCVADGYDNKVILDKDYFRYGLGFDEISKIISDFSPDVVGVSCLFSTQQANAQSICKIVKGIDRKIITVLGGAHPSATAQKQLEEKDIDFVVLGEGERVFKELIREFSKTGKFSLIDGLAFKEDGKIRVNPKNQFVVDLDELPFPDWSFLPMEKYALINRPHGGYTKRIPFVPMITSRGCPNNCNFCSVHNIWGKSFRKRSAENVLSEMKHMVDRFGIKEIHFEDDNLTLDRQRALSIFKGIKEGNYDISWALPNGVYVDTIDEVMIDAMADSGCFSISFGIESGDEYMLSKVIRKRINLKRIPAVVAYAKKKGLETSAFFVVGFPEESKETLRNTFKFARKLKADAVNFFFCTPLPGTELWDQAKAHFLLPQAIDYRSLVSASANFAPFLISKKALQAAVSKEKLILKARLMFFAPGMFFKKIARRLKRIFILR